MERKGKTEKGQMKMRKTGRSGENPTKKMKVGNISRACTAVAVPLTAFN